MVQRRENISSRPPTLGRQCLSCSRRRVKCDSTTPACQRCQLDDLECPGYTKKLRWCHYQHGLPTPWKEIGVGDGESGNVSIINSLVFPLSVDEKENRLLFECQQYYNSNILPDFVPGHLPFKRQALSAQEIAAVPSLIRHTIILLVRTAQENRSSEEPVSTAVVCHYRGQSLEDLKTALPEAVVEPYGIVLSGIIILMGIEMQNQAFGSWNWTYHLQAARRILELRGGFDNCFLQMKWSQTLLINFMMADIMSSTTNNARSLKSARSTSLQSRYIPLLILRERQIIENGRVCPQALLQSIIRTNILRISTQGPALVSVIADEKVRSFGEIQNDIQLFNASSWAEKVSHYGMSRPIRFQDCPTPTTINVWTSLALCYKHATLLYLLLSIQAPTTTEGTANIRTLQSYLSDHTASLMSQASTDPDGPMETMLEIPPLAHLHRYVRSSLLVLRDGYRNE